MRGLWSLLAAALSPLVRGNPGPADTERLSFAAEPGGLLVADVERCSIEVHTWDRPAVKLVLEGSPKLELKCRREEGRTTVQVQKKMAKDPSVMSRIMGAATWGQPPRLILTVPLRQDLELTTAGGSIDLGRLQGGVRASTEGGGFNCAHIEGTVDARTEGGDIRIEDLAGDLVARSSGGDVHLSSIRGAAEVCAGGGSIHLRLSRQPGVPCLLGTSGGEMEVFLAADLGLCLDARTSGGCLTTDFPLTFQGALEKSGLKASVNGGGPLVTLSTAGGSIRLHKIGGARGMMPGS